MQKMYTRQKLFLLIIMDLIIEVYSEMISEFIAVPDDIEVQTTESDPSLLGYSNVSALKYWSAVKHGGSYDYLIKTEGCTIPNYGKTIPYEEATDWKIACDKRIVSVTKTADDEVTMTIDYSTIDRKKSRFICCYKFAIRSTSPGLEDEFLKFSKCRRFFDGTVIKLEEEIITVTCGMRLKNQNYTVLMYKDAYLILKKKPVAAVGDTKDWNVLILGMDSMSRARAYHSLPRVVKYFQEHQWLDFRGYNKIEYNTFPNLMALLSGKPPNETSRLCGHSIERCKNMLIWKRYKDAGYMTAFGEASRTDTFTPYRGFRLPPTDHYAKPFFTLKQYTRGNTVCLRSKSVGLRLLNYAKQFTDAYGEENFFALFWLSCFSHEPFHLPSTSENMLLAFFDHLQQSGVLKNTFIIFLSDHGFNFGGNRFSKESYYDSRLPMLFMWIPPKFQKRYKKEYTNLIMNQYRLITPYDLHGTLSKILVLSDTSSKARLPDGCRRCKGLFSTISNYRTCRDVNINEVWCTCHKLKETPKTSRDFESSLKAAVQFVQKAARAVKTETCTGCVPLVLNKPIRNHWYQRKSKLYFIVAFTMSPMDLSYESVIKKRGKHFDVISTRTIIAYNPKSTCVRDKYAARAYCICQNTC